MFKLELRPELGKLGLLGTDCCASRSVQNGVGILYVVLLMSRAELALQRAVFSLRSKRTLHTTI